MVQSHFEGGRGASLGEEKDEQAALLYSLRGETVKIDGKRTSIWLHESIACLGVVRAEKLVQIRDFERRQPRGECAERE
tara:strand:+ start:672 stop:908 length:237 start_codon:yes stop_codon:yes gene_type:complete